MVLMVFRLLAKWKFKCLNLIFRNLIQVMIVSFDLLIMFILLIINLFQFKICCKVCSFDMIRKTSELFGFISEWYWAWFGEWLLVVYCLIICFKFIYELKIGRLMVCWLWVRRRNEFKYYFMNRCWLSLVSVCIVYWCYWW